MATEETTYSEFEAVALNEEYMDVLLGKLAFKELDMSHARYQVVNFLKDFEARYNLVKNIKINLGKTAKCYRLCVGYGKIIVCIWNISLLVVYDL